MSALAWVVKPNSDSHDEDMGSHVVHAPTRNKARALGCGLLDLDYTEVQAKRAPQFDGLTGSQLTRAQLADGWYLPCGGCDTVLTSDGEVSYPDDDTDEIATAGRYVFRGSDVYCSSSCCMDRMRDEQRYRENEWETVREACERWPGIEVVLWSGLTFGEDENRNAVVGSVRFRFPGGLGQVGWVRLARSVSVELRDHEAWQVFAEACDARRAA